MATFDNLTQIHSRNKRMLAGIHRMITIQKTIYNLNPIIISLRMSLQNLEYDLLH